jgi:hypothetical protein
MKKSIYIVSLMILLLSCKSQFFKSKRDCRIKGGYDYRLQLRNLSNKIIVTNQYPLYFVKISKKNLWQKYKNK